jgi:hypothetical protein
MAEQRKTVATPVTTLLHERQMTILQQSTSEIMVYIIVSPFQISFVYNTAE